MHKLKNMAHRYVCCTVAVILLLLTVFQNLFGNVSSKYVREYTLENSIAIEANHFTVSYYDSESVLLKQYDVFSNSTHTLQDPAAVGLEIANDREFLYWTYANGNKVTETTFTSTINLFAFLSVMDTYTVRFMDAKGETLLAAETFTKGKTNTGDITPPTAPDLKDMGLEFDCWMVHTDSGLVAWESYDLKNATKDVVVYANYIYSGSLGLEGIDENEDGIVDYYQLNAVDSLPADVKIPGNINGIPVTIITDLASGLAGNVQTIVIEDGVEIINPDAFAWTPNLNYVKIPASIQSVGSGTFANSVGGGLTDLFGAGKKITIEYDGIWNEWLAVAESGWDSGLAAGTRVICTDGTYEKTGRSWNTGTDYWKKIQNN